MAKVIEKKKVKRKGLSDAELIAKYDTGEKVDLGKFIALSGKMKQPAKKALATKK